MKIILTMRGDNHSHLPEVLDLLGRVKNHSSYLIRIKLYQNEQMDDTAQLLKAIVHKYQELEPSVQEYHDVSIQSYTNEIAECITIILSYEEYNLTLHDLIRYSILIRELIDDLDDFLTGITQQSGADIREIEETIEELDLEKLRHTYEDNIDQILKSFAWKEYESEILQSDKEEEFFKFSRLLAKFNSSKVTGSQIEDRAILETLARLSSAIKDLLGLNFEDVFSLIPLLDALCKLFSKNIDPRNGEEIISKTYLRNTVDTLVRVSRVKWMGNFFDSVQEDLPDNDAYLVHIKFAKEFAKVTRDPRDDFLWTMSYYSRLTDDPQISDLSYKVANLTGILLTIVDRLEKRQETSLVKSIINLDSISYKDAISDLGEIYQKQSNWGEYMKNALRTKLSQLKDILLQIIQFQDIADEVILMLQFVVSSEHELHPVTPDRLGYIISEY